MLPSHKSVKWAATAIAVLAVMMLSSAAAQAGSVLYVDDDAPLGGDGTSWDTAYRFLQDALTAAPGGGVTEVHVAQGTYTPDRGEANPDGTGDREATFQLINAVSLMGGYAGFGEPDPDARDIDLYETMLSGDLLGNDGPDFANYLENSYHVTTGSGTGETDILDGFTITGGNANGSFPNNRGGGMYNNSSSSMVTNCTFRNNSRIAVFSTGGSNTTFSDCSFIANRAAVSGGAILTTDSSLVVTWCRFIMNTAVFDGGAIHVQGGSSSFTNCYFFANESGEDGGAVNVVSDPLVLNCTFEGNSAGSDGGAFRATGLTHIIGCRFVGNVAWVGGAVYKTYPDKELRLFGSVFQNNQSARRGGAIATTSPTSIINCTVVGNHASDVGGGGLSMSSSDAYGTVVNSIFWGNTSDDEGDQIHANGQQETTVSYSIIEGGKDGVATNGGVLNWGPGNSADDPLLMEPTKGDLHLKAGSPAVDAGNNAEVFADDFDVDADGDTDEPIPFDLDGNPRFVDDPDSPDCWQAPGTCGDPPIVDMGAYEFQPPPPCPWDLNGDGVVNVHDLLELVFDFGPCDNPDDCPSDFNGDGFVGVADLLILIVHFGPCPASNACPWDLDGDGVVGAADLLLLLQHLGPCDDPDDCPWDFDGDGFVGVSDLLALVHNFGPCPEG